MSFFSIQKLLFDSELFHYPVGKVIWDPLLLEEDFLKKVIDFQLVYIFSEHPISFISPKIQLVDIKVTFEKKIFETSKTPEIFLIEDVFQKFGDHGIKEKLKVLAFESGQFSRFRLDHRLNSKEFEKLYEVWIDKALTKGNLFVSNDLSGMVTFHEKNKETQIGLIAVDSKRRGKSWGKKLMKAVEGETLARGLNQIKVSTQESNLPAMEFYKNLGYSISEKWWIYHYCRG